MRKLLLALLLIPQIALADRSFYSAFSLVPGATAQGDLIIKNNQWINWLNAGGAQSNVLRVTASDNTQLNAASGANLFFAINGLNRYSISSAGDLTQDATNGGNIVQSKALSSHLISQGLTAIPADISGSWYAPIYSFSSGTVPTIVEAYGAANTSGPNHYFMKSRNTNGSADTIVASGDTIGTIGFYGADGASFRAAAEIAAIVDTTPGASDMPGGLVFKTTPDGAASLLTRWTINNAGNLTGDATNGGDLILAKSGSTLSIQENSASTACLGVATPNGTTPVTVTTSCATSAARVIYSRNGAITNVGSVTTTTAPNGSSFAFASTSATDTTTSVVWFIIKESA